MKRLILTILLVASVATGALAQVNVGVITGKVVSRQGREPIEQATVTIKGTGFATESVTTDYKGEFTFTDIPLWIIGLSVLVLLVASFALILRFFNRRGPHGADSQLLSPVLGNIMLDTVMKLSSPVFICDEKEERIIWYNRALSVVCDTGAQLYGHKAEEFLNIPAAELLRENVSDGIPVMIGDHSFRATASRIRAKDQ